MANPEVADETLCKYCQIRFASKNILQSHSILIHGKHDQRQCENRGKQKLLIVSLISYTKAKSDLKCERCRSTFALNNHLSKHMASNQCRREVIRGKEQKIPNEIIEHTTRNISKPPAMKKEFRCEKCVHLF